MKSRLAGLALTATLLASCGINPTPVEVKPPVQPPVVVTPTDPAAVAPAAPVAGQALDVSQMPVQAQATAVTLQSMTSPADMDPDLAALVNTLMGNRASAAPLGLPGQQGFAKLLGKRGGSGALRAQGMAGDTKMRTGTTIYHQDGTLTELTTPTDAWVQINEPLDFEITAEWYVGGAPSQWVEVPAYGGGIERVEVPTKARATIKRSGVLAAAMDLSMDAGPCAYPLGPVALSASGWAGKESAPAAKLSVKHEWTDAGIKSSVDASYKSQSRQAAFSAAVDVRGTTANRCDLSKFSFTPTRADLQTKLSAPGNDINAKLYLRNVKNIEFSATKMQTSAWYMPVEGDLNASLTYNGKPAMTAFGPLGDGGDMDLLPGDQVKVKYVKDNALVEETLPQAIDKLVVLLPY